MPELIGFVCAACGRTVYTLAGAPLCRRCHKSQEEAAVSNDVKYPRYLGDAVYASVTNGLVKLHTSDGRTETNIIYLEVETLDAFLEWLADMRVSMVAEREKKDA